MLALAVDPRNDSVLYAATPGGGIWKSEDGGDTWIPRFDSAPRPQVCSLTIDPRNPDIVYVGTGDDESPRPGQGIGRSSDGARGWVFSARFTSQPVCALAVDPADTRRIFAGSAEGLFVSADAGTSWNKVLSSAITSIVFDAQRNIFVGMVGDDAPGLRENLLAYSTDAGSTWTSIALPANPNAPAAETTWVTVLPTADALSVAVSYRLSAPLPGTDNVFPPPASELDFYRSTDRGVTWSTTFAIGQVRPPMQMLADPSTGNLYLTGTRLLISSSQGVSWDSSVTAGADFHTAVFTRGSVLLGGDTGFQAVPLVLGGTASSVSQMPIGRFLSTSFDSTTGVWGAGPAGLLHLFPLGTNPPEVRVPQIGAAGRVRIAGTSANIFVSANRRIYTSNDRGSSFSGSTVIPDGELRAPFPPIALDSANTATAFTGGRRIYRTNDSGASWTALALVDSDPASVVIALTVAPAVRTTMYAATACLPEVALISCPQVSRIWRSANGGQSWVQASIVEGFVNQIAIDPRITNIVYAAIGAFPAGASRSAGYIPGDLLQSTNQGATWSSIRRNLPFSPVNTILIDPASLPPQITQPAQRLFVGTDSGVFASFNAGVQWIDISSSPGSELPQSPVTDLALRSDGTLLAATFGRGIYSTSLTGLAAGIVASQLSIELTVTEGATITTGIPINNVSTGSTFGWRLTALESWINVPEPTGVLRPASSFEVPIRISAAGLRAGTYIGRMVLLSGPYTQRILVTVHVTASPAQMIIIGGNNAAGAASTTLPPLQVLVSDANQAPLPGVAVTFEIASGGGSLTARTVVTNFVGIAGTTLTLPSVPGPVRVVARIGSLSATFTVSAVPAPSLMADSVVDGVTFNTYTSFGPGSILSISGQNLAAGPSSDTRVVLLTPSGEMPLLLVSVSTQQIKALLPLDIAPGTYRIRVEVGAGRSNEIQIVVAAFAPAIFTVKERGRGLGVFVKEDGSLVTTANPADRGSVVTFYAAGLGQVDPSNQTIRTPRVFFDIYQAEVLYSGLAPEIAGRYQVTVRVPAFVSPATNISVSMTIGGFASNRVTIPVQ
ncbi:MAG: hypothetical protein HY646_20105 [Acidobacteria bacterium]|nr:hypothetical protein [Acidobacteriota bacterium]